MLAEIKKLRSINNELQIRAARNGIEAFTDSTFPKYIKGTHTRILCRFLDAWVNNDIKNLIIELPPRHGKSQHVSRELPAYIFGLNPDEHIIACSYSKDLASKMNRDVQRIMETQDYVNIFPETQLAGAQDAKKGTYSRTDTLFEIVGREGHYRCAGVGGGITGMGFTKGIIDDYIKNREEAESEVIRNKIWEWYTSTFYTRREENASILITATRWHEDDLIGRILKSEHADQWRVLTLRAIREEEDNEDDPREVGEALWPERFPIDQLEDIKKAIGSRDFAALYQQRPAAMEGTIFKRKFWKFYDELPAYPPIRTIHSWDTDYGKKAAHSGGLMGKEYPHGLYLTAMFDESLEYPQLVSQVQIEHTADPADAVLVEDKASGQSLLQSLAQETTVPAVACQPTGDKVTRAYAASPYCEAGNVYLPRQQAWTKEFIDIMAKFPDIKLKDIPDAFSQMVRWIKENQCGNVEIVSASVPKPKIQGF